MRHIFISFIRFLKKAFIFCFVFSSSELGAQTIVDRIEIINPITNTVSKAGETYPHYENVWYLSGCLNDLVYITMKQSGNYVLRKPNSTILAKSNGSSLIMAKFKEVNSATVINLDDNSVSEYLNVIGTVQPSDITSMTWNVGNDDTLGICEKTYFTPPLGISYYSASSNTRGNSEINSSFFYEVNGAALSNLNVRSLKNGDIIRIGKPKGVDAINFPSCAVEVAETLYSQKVVVKLVNTAGALSQAIGMGGYREICPGDSILLSVFYSQCVGSYVKNREPYPTTGWVDPNTSYYRPYKQAIVTAPGIYNLIQADFPQCGNNKFNCPVASPDFVVVERPQCKNRYLVGTVYRDGDNNARYQTEEITYKDVTIKISDLVMDTLIGYAYSDQFGYYEFGTDLSLVNGCKITIVNKDYRPVSVTVPKISSYTKVDLATQYFRNNIKVVAAAGRSRPGFSIPIYFTVSNLSSSLLQKYTVRLAYDKKLNDLRSFTTVPTSSLDNVLVWEMTSLKSVDNKSVSFFATLPSSAAIGDVLYYTISVEPTPLDSNLKDNSLTFTSTITGSLDPNEKLLRTNSPSKDLVQDTTTLDYTILFQNMGTDTAFRVVIKDKLSPVLDFGAFAMLDASHPYSLNLKEDTLIWTFSNIQLPDNKTNEPASHGHVHFKIKPKLKTPYGMKIQNKAAIFFDYNDPVITNTTSCTLGIPLVSGLEKENVVEEELYYPNPTNGNLTINSRSGGKWELLDISGQVLKTANLSAGLQTLDIAELHAGTYLCRLSSGENVRYSKLVKME